MSKCDRESSNSTTLLSLEPAHTDYCHSYISDLGKNKMFCLSLVLKQQKKMLFLTEIIVQLKFIFN